MVGHVNLKEWARLQGVHPQTTYQWFRERTLPVPAVRVNSRSVLVAPDAALVEHRDRLRRMNTELVGAALSAHGAGWPSWTSMRWTTIWCGT